MNLFEKKVKFSGFVGFEPIEATILEETDYGMAYIEHPKGQWYERFGKNCVFVEVKKHLTFVK